MIYEKVVYMRENISSPYVKMAKEALKDIESGNAVPFENLFDDSDILSKKIQSSMKRLITKN